MLWLIIRYRRKVPEEIVGEERESQAKAGQSQDCEQCAVAKAGEPRVRMGRGGKCQKEMTCMLVSYIPS